MVRPSTRSAPLSRPSKRVARPPARMAAECWFMLWLLTYHRWLLEPSRIGHDTAFMREAGIGRVLVASLHQGIADILPTRLGFYENWLNVEGLREGTIGLAPLYAVLSFLRLEGEAYELITTRAGEYAAQWTVESMAPLHRTFVKATPEWLRGRLVLRLANQVVRSSYGGSRVIVRMHRKTASLDLRASV